MKKESIQTICAKEVGGIGDNPPHILPIYQSAAFDFKTIDRSIEIFENQYSGDGYIYTRYGNPTVDQVAKKIAQLECFDLDVEAQAYLCGSGMAAISVVCLGLLSAGESILIHQNLYGGSTELFRSILSDKGIHLYQGNLKDTAFVDEFLRNHPEVEVVYFETPSNPLLECVDIEVLTRLCRKYECFSVMDNTMSTPLLQRPFNFGVDFIVHSTTKYLNGHGTSVGGIIIGRDRNLMQKTVWKALKLIGASVSPFDAWLLHNGLKTLAIRMEKQCSNALEIARFLESNSKIDKVYYLGLESHPDYDLANKQMNGHGAIISVELKGTYQTALNFMNKLKLCSITPTLGDVDTLVLHPASSSHINIPKEERMRTHITDNLVRLSIGIEDSEDLIMDLSQALEHA